MEKTWLSVDEGRVLISRHEPTPRGFAYELTRNRFGMLIVTNYGLRPTLAVDGAVFASIKAFLLIPDP